MDFYCFTGKIPALEEVWCVGDIFLSFAAGHATSLANEFDAQKCKQMYIFNRYDVKSMTTPLLNTNYVLVRLQNALANHLNNTVKLPRLLIVILDKDFIKLGDATYSDMAVRELVSSLFTTIQERKEQLQKKCIRSSEPKFIFVKPTPKYSLIDIGDEYKNMKRSFNKTLEKNIELQFLARGLSISHEIRRISRNPHEIRRIPGEIHPKPRKIRRVFAETSAPDF